MTKKEEYEVPFDEPCYTEDEVSCPTCHRANDYIVVDGEDIFPEEATEEEVKARAFCTNCGTKLEVEVELEPHFSCAKKVTDEKWKRARDSWQPKLVNKN